MSYADVDRTLGPVLDFHAAHAKEYQELTSRLKAAEGDRDAALKAFIDSSDDEELVKLRAVVEKAQRRMQEVAEQKVVSETLDETAKGKLQSRLEELKTEFRDGRKAILSIAETMKSTVNVEEVQKALDEIGDPTRSGRGRKVGSTGSSLPKASAQLVLTNSNGSFTHETFGAAAKLAGVSVEALQKAYAEAAGVDHADIASVGKPLEFTVSGTNGEFNVKTTPKERRKPGPRPGGNAAHAKAA